MYLTPYEEVDLTPYAINEYMEEAIAQVKQESISTSNTYTDEQIESALIYVKNEDIEALF